MVGQANEKEQIGGTHYRIHGNELQHWDVVRMFRLDYLIGTATKYLFRWQHKGGVQDLKKAMHYIEKRIEQEEAEHPPLVQYGTRPAPIIGEARNEVNSLVGGIFGDADTVYIDNVKFVRLDRVASGDLFGEVVRREKEAEAASMNAHAASLSDGEDEDRADGDSTPIENSEEVYFDTRPRCGTCLLLLPDHAPSCEEVKTSAPLRQTIEPHTETRWKCNGCGTLLDTPGNGHVRRALTEHDDKVACPVNAGLWYARVPAAAGNAAPSAAPAPPGAAAPLAGL
jgi:hypothetical protein